MTHITIKMDTDNAAFADNGESQEIARILRKLADRLEREETTYARLMDINGNKVGEYNVNR